MSNTLLTPSIIAKEALMQLDNNLVMGNLVHRDYEGEYAKQVNGNKIGDTITIRRPVRYTVRDGATMSVQDSTEGSTTIVVNKQKGVDMQFSSTDLTLKIAQFSERYIKPAMIQLANQVDTDMHAEAYQNTWNWVGTAGQVVNSYADFALAPQRLDEMAVPMPRAGVLSPADNWGMLGNLSSLYISDTAKTALEKAKLPMIGGVDLYGTQNVQTHTVGPLGGSPQVDGATQYTTYASSKDTGTMALATKGWTAAAANRLKKGDVFTIDGVYAVNPVTKAALSYLQQFVVKSNFDSGSDGKGNVTISPPIITSGAYQTVSAAPADSANINVKGTASTGYAQNLVFHKNAFAMCMVPMELPQGAVNPHRESYKGLSVRVIPVYDGTNDVGKWRFDILYGVKAIYPDLACRLSGT